MISLLGYSYSDLLKLIEVKYGRGKYHAKLLFENIYQRGVLSSGKLDAALAHEFSVDLPVVSSSIEEGGTTKFLLKLDDGYESETIILPMGSYNTLCVSSQIGCRWACAFCETGKMGIKRDLTTGEIISQLLTAELVFKKKIRNIVFMGMGEAFDNFDNVMGTIDIMTHPWAMNLNMKSICISTVGHVEGIRRLISLTGQKSNNYHKLHLAVSLNGADDEIRSRLMPVNRKWPLSELKSALMETYQFGKKGLLYLEYILIEGLTDGESNGNKLIAYANGFPNITLNIIPYNPGIGSEFKKPNQVELDRFHYQIRNAGIKCYTRYSQGDQIMAACGQLGNKKLAR